jgi:hypothetical protein
MEGNVWRPTHLTLEQMEERRLVGTDPQPTGLSNPAMGLKHAVFRPLMVTKERNPRRE